MRSGYALPTGERVHTGKERNMKKKWMIASIFAVSYAVVLGLCLECLLNLMGAVMAVSLDSGAVTRQYPRFIPFCVVVSLLTLTALVLLLVLNIKISHKQVYTKKTWWVQSVAALVMTIPMIKLWEVLLDFLHKVL